MAFPPFPVFSQFVRREAKARNDPSFSLSSSITPSMRRERLGNQTPGNIASIRKTDVLSNPTTNTAKQIEDLNRMCPLHKKPHAFRKCKVFRGMLLDDRRKFLRDNGICFRCCASVCHQAKNCSTPIKCMECNSEKHVAALHPGPAPKETRQTEASKDHGGEPSGAPEDPSDSASTSMCTHVCGGIKGKSCAKMCLVYVYPQGHCPQKRKMYVILNEQSNVSLAKTAFFDVFEIKGAAEPYVLKTCAGVVTTKGRRAHGYVVESLDGNVSIQLSTLIECNRMLDNREEIPTPEAAYHHDHLRAIASEIPPLDSSADILLLLGRDIVRVHKVLQQYNRPRDAPFAQKLDLGWVIVGDVCLGGAHAPKAVSSFKTCLLDNGRPSHLLPCGNVVNVKEDFSGGIKAQGLLASEDAMDSYAQPGHHLGDTVFQRTEKDHHLAPSVEDQVFMQLMERGFHKEETRHWVAPLPFRRPRKWLPNNRQYAFQRLMSLRHSFEKKPSMKNDFVEFMKRAQSLLACHNIRLHKIASNKADVINAFPTEDRVQNTTSRDFVVDDLAVQRSLGIAWNMTTDTFMFNIPEAQKPFTRRGVLSTINSVFDPLGFLAPVTVQGRMLLRELMSQGAEWDTPLPSEKLAE